MSTTNQSYIDALWTVQNNRPVLPHAPLIGNNETILDIDLDTRKITAPKFLSVQKDHQAETVYFRVNRYFEHQDLATKLCVIQYKNANGDEYIYPVPSYDLHTYAVFDPITNTDQATQILIPWCIQGPATEKAGTVKFSVKFFKLNNNREIIYELNTMPVESQILEGQNWDLTEFSQNQFTLDNEFMANIAIIQELAQTGFTINWLDL